MYATAGFKKVIDKTNEEYKQRILILCSCQENWCPNGVYLWSWTSL